MTCRRWRRIKVQWGGPEEGNDLMRVTAAKVACRYGNSRESIHQRRLRSLLTEHLPPHYNRREAQAKCREAEECERRQRMQQETVSQPCHHKQSRSAREREKEGEREAESSREREKG